MTKMDKKLKMIYDAATNTICKLHNEQMSLSQEEMYFLISLLDRVVQGKVDQNFLNSLRKWQAGQGAQEIDEIIKATLLPLDLGDDEAVENAGTLILELINYENDGEND